MDNSDDEEDISPNPDIAIEYGRDKAEDKGEMEEQKKNKRDDT